jgi:hypothetical protein
MFDVNLGRAGPEPLHDQVAAQISRAIAEGEADGGLPHTLGPPRTCTSRGQARFAGENSQQRQARRPIVNRNRR